MALTLAMVAAGCGGSKSETTPTEKWAGDLCSAVGTWRTSITSIASSVQTNGVTKDSLTNALERAKSDTKKLTDDLKGLGRPNTQAGKEARTMVADVVGPVCETGDYLALDRTLPVPKVGDLLAIMTAGAYGAVQSGTYNTRPLIPEVLVKDDQYAVVRPRLDVDDLIAMDRSAPWL